ncbi:hypothetical protein ACS3UN_01400 [Oscillospiraceae bacterium LTW-04]|nr:hypothetical protein RBH76_09060 [Oscillospiraceae bacterium MB24-C1]
MITETQAAELFAFFEKYTSALNTMARDEKEKLNALLSNSLPRIEHAISTAQANTKLIENLESKRIALQESLGCSQLTFSQLIEEIPETHKLSLSSLFRQIQSSVDEIRFTNDKSMVVAHTNITRLNPESLVPQPNSDAAPSATPYSAALSHQGTNAPSIFKTKA